jgi:hypothetical protein
VIGAGAALNNPNIFNCTVIGSNTPGAGSNSARIGNNTVTTIGGFANWTNFSDGRFKVNMKEDVEGLDFILQLRPVTYNLDVQQINSRLFAHKKDKTFSVTEQNAIRAKTAIRQSGFVAQEVEAAARKLGYDFSGVDAPKNENDFYGLRYAEFVVPLVKAVQEQQALIQQQTKTIEELLKRVEKLEKQNP